MGRRLWSDDDMLDALRAVAKQVDGPLRWDDYERLRERGARPAPATITARYGSWWDALYAAGLAEGVQQRSWSAEEARDGLARWLATTGDARLVGYEAARRDGADVAPLHVLRARFGGWKPAVAEARQNAGEL